MLERSIPVLMYHHVSPAGGELNVTPELFDDQLSMIRQKGWKTLSGDEFLGLFQRNKLPGKHLLLTFDDGFADNYVFAYPLLKKHGMKAMLFVTASMIEDVALPRPDFIPRTHKEAWGMAMTESNTGVMCRWNELKEMQDSGVFDIQAHGMTHTTHSLIREGRYDELRHDLAAGKKILEERLAKKMLHLAWPKGIYDGRALEIAVELGFKALYTTERGANTAQNLTGIKRVPVKNKDGKWLSSKLRIYSSPLLTSLYLSVRTGI